MTKITVIITTYPHQNRSTELTKCLRSIKVQNFKDFEILIVENYTDTSKLPNITGYRNLRIICDPAKKLSRIFNTCWQNATTELLAFVADDVEVDTFWLENIAKELELEDNVAVVTGPIISSCYPAGEMHRLYLFSQKNVFTKALSWPYLYFAMNGSPFLPGKLFESGAYSFGASLKESEHFNKQEIDLATTSSMGIRKSAIEQLGGFDERFSFNHADGDLFVRLKKIDYKIIFNPNIKAIHHMSVGPSRNPYFVGKDTAIFYKKNVRPATFGGFLGALLNVLVINIYWIYSAIQKKDIRQLRGIGGFIEGLFS